MIRTVVLYTVLCTLLSKLHQAQTLTIVIASLESVIDFGYLVLGILRQVTEKLHHKGIFFGHILAVRHPVSNSVKNSFLLLAFKQKS